jgi:MFS family permease
VDREISSIREVLELEREHAGTLRDLGSRMVRPALVVALGLAIGQQFCGVNAINLYAPTIFTSLGLGASASILTTVGLGVAKVILTVVTILLVDRWGRRPLLLVGSVCMAVTLFLLGLASLIFGSSPSISVVTFVLLIVYLAGYEIGWGAVVWVMLSEIFPLRVRGIGMGVGSVAVWASTFAITFVFPVMDSGLGLSYSAWIFALICVLGFVFVHRLVPETTGRGLEDIERELRARTAG